MTKSRQPLKGFICAVTACLLLAAAPARAQTAASSCAKMDDIRVMVFATLFLNMVTYIAKDAGLFERNCLNAALVPIASGPAGMAQLQSGSIHFSDSSIDNTLVARHRGLPIKIVTGESSANPYSIVARADLPLPNAKSGYPAVMKDLVRKKLGVFALGTGSELFFKYLLRGAGVDPQQVTFIAVGSAPTQFAALENKSVDAIIMTDPGQDLAEQGGLGKIIVDMRNPGVGPKEITALAGTFQVKVASDEFIRKNPDIVRRYVEANRQTVQWIQAPQNREKLVEFMRSHVSFGRSVPNSDTIFRKLVDRYAAASMVEVRKSSINGWNQLQVNAGNIPAPVQWADVVWSGAPQAD